MKKYNLKRIPVIAVFTGATLFAAARIFRNVRGKGISDIKPCEPRFSHDVKQDCSEKPMRDGYYDWQDIPNEVVRPKTRKKELNVGNHE